MSEKSKIRIVVLAGLPLSCKERLSKITGAIYLDVDYARQEISQGRAWLGPEQEKEMMLAAYKLNHLKAEKHLKAGASVILGATYSRPIYHQMLEELAAETNASLNVYLLQIPDEVVLERINKRKAEKTKSNIKTTSSYQEVKDRYVAYPEAITINSSESIKHILEKIVDTLNK